jgi:hypothetical protein
MYKTMCEVKTPTVIRMRYRHFKDFFFSSFFFLFLDHVLHRFTGWCKSQAHSAAAAAVPAAAFPAVTASTAPHMHAASSASPPHIAAAAAAAADIWLKSTNQKRTGRSHIGATRVTSTTTDAL